ncbi:MAG: beta-ketoacyl-ACP synthase II [Proteobacteria bacterium]|nr:beta-ketoacyl-ACP synthase II [Pseudomonadota bacterium]
MRQVVVTGLGIVSPVGNDPRSAWESVLNGKSGIGRITHFDPSNSPVRIAGEVRGFNAEEYISKKEIKKMDHFIQYGRAASRQALKDAGIEIEESFAEEVGVSIGTAIGGLPAIERNHRVLLERGPERVSPFFIPMTISNLAAGQVAIYTGAKGPNLAPVTACASGTHAIGEAYRMIQRGEAEVMIAGGTEAAITPLSIAGFDAMRVLSRRNENPEGASRPFDLERDGFILGEGAGILILEERERARRRGAKIYAELIGYGATCDAFHLSSPNPSGEGAARAMKAALKEGASRNGIKIKYINAHGTSTPTGDAIETRAIREVFGSASEGLMVSATKSMTGHLLGAAGGVEAIFTVLTIKEGRVPPTINYRNPDPECDLDYVPNEARQARVEAALSNSFGFGGTNACLFFHQV